MFYGKSDSRIFSIAYETISGLSAFIADDAAKACGGAAVINILLTTVCLNSGESSDL